LSGFGGNERGSISDCTPSLNSYFITPDVIAAASDQAHIDVEGARQDIQTPDMRSNKNDDPDTRRKGSDNPNHDENGASKVAACVLEGN
jgi:hypothetical protein